MRRGAGAPGAEDIGVLARGAVRVRDDPFDLDVDRHALPVVDVEKATQRSAGLGTRNGPNWA